MHAYLHEFTKHLVIDDKDAYREDTTIGTPFELPENIKKIEMVCF